jgi:peptidoglycan endopeptidase LytF
MSRRDTIIIAVLLNAGLLIVLFATSLKSDKAEDEPSAITVLASNQSEVKDVTPPQLITPVVAPATHDPVDRVIEQYVTPQVASSEQQNSNFLADLQAIGTPAASSETPVNAPQQAAAPEATYKEVKVKKGDVLERIARQNHVSVSEIMKANKLTSTRLKIGQVLKIPANTASKTASAATVAGAQYYTIKPGDNPWTIAVKHHMKVEDLLRLNNMDEQKAKRLKAGDKIRIN